jgi:hypothetical protein
MGRIHNREATEILLSRMAVVLWKMTIVCAFPGPFLVILRRNSEQSPSLSLPSKCNGSSVNRNSLRTALVTSEVTNRWPPTS